MQRRSASLDLRRGAQFQQGELHPEMSDSSWISDAGSFSRLGGFNAPSLTVHFEGDEVVEISDISTGVLDSDQNMDQV